MSSPVYTCLTLLVALAYYDHLLTLRDEVRFIWRRRFSGVAVVFVLTRYGALVNSALVIAQIPSSLHRQEGGLRHVFTMNI